MASPNSHGRSNNENLLSAYQNRSLSRQVLVPAENQPNRDTMSLAECYQGIGRLQQQLEDKDAKVAELMEEKSAWTIAHEEVHDELVHLKVLLRRVENENKKLIQDNEFLDKERKQQDVMIKQLNDQLVKAQKTIKVQSDQISSRNRTTPQHQPPLGGSFKQIYSQSPPIYNPSPSKTPSNKPTPASAHAPSPSRQPSSALRHAPPPMSQQASTASFQPSNVPNDRRLTIAVTPIHNPFVDGQLTKTAVHHSLHVHVRGEWNPFFHKSESFSRDYANVPDMGKDAILPQDLRNHMRQHTNPEIQKFLASGNTRYLTVAKVINHMIVNFAFKPALIKGFGQFFDNKYGEYLQQLHQVAIPMNVRRATLVASAELIVEMTKTKGFRAWQDEIIQGQIHKMWVFLEPLFAPNINRNDAWKALSHIWHEAARIGLIMLSKASIFQFDFPPIGANTHFNPSNMLSREANYDHKGQSPEGAPATVRLSITPIVTETDFAANMVAPMTVHKAHVLLKF